jgi:hypothetical protein
MTLDKIPLLYLLASKATICLVETSYRAQGVFSQHFIFLVTYHWAQNARVLQYNKLERLARDKHSCSLDPFVSYEENEVL